MAAFLAGQQVMLQREQADGKAEAFFQEVQTTLLEGAQVQSCPF